jgi:hypothetical protein
MACLAAVGAELVRGTVPAIVAHFSARGANTPRAAARFRHDSQISVHGIGARRLLQNGAAIGSTSNGGQTNKRRTSLTPYAPSFCKPCMSAEPEIEQRSAEQARSHELRRRQHQEPVNRGARHYYIITERLKSTRGCRAWCASGGVPCSPTRCAQVRHTGGMSTLSF